MFSGTVSRNIWHFNTRKCALIKKKKEINQDGKANLRINYIILQDIDLREVLIRVMLNNNKKN